MHPEKKNKKTSLVNSRINGLKFEGGIKDTGRNSGRRRRPIQRGKTVLKAPSTACRPSGSLKVRVAIQLVEDDGWYRVRTRGSHRQFCHPSKLGTVTIPGHLRDDLPKGTWNSIQKQAGLRGKAK